jgi:hypothetical protein
MQTASELIRNLQNSPTKAIDPVLKNSVHRLIVNERKKLNAVLLEGIEVTDQLGTIQQLTDRIWFSVARKAHIAGIQNKQPQCIPLHKVFCIGRAFNSEETYTMLAFATPWNLLNYFRAVGAGYPVMLQGDVTGKASSLALNKLGLGFNRLGGRANDIVKCNIAGMPYKAPRKELAIDSPLGDQSHAWKNMCLNQLGVTSRVCQTHASSINGLNGGFRKHFVSPTHP